jgi:hypothetical protein
MVHTMATNHEYSLGVNHHHCRPMVVRALVCWMRQLVYEYHDPLSVQHRQHLSILNRYPRAQSSLFRHKDRHEVEK